MGVAKAALETSVSFYGFRPSNIRVNAILASSMKTLQEQQFLAQDMFLDFLKIIHR